MRGALCGIGDTIDTAVGVVVAQAAATIGVFGAGLGGFETFDTGLCVRIT